MDFLLGIAFILIGISEICLYIMIANLDPRSKLYNKIDPIENNDKKKELINDLPVDMSRQQRRLFEKQLNDFESKFSHFSNYQLKLISDLCLDIINKRGVKYEK